MSDRQWTNRDLASSPPQDRKWTQWTFLAFWTAHAAGAGSWVAGSSLISVGLEPLSAYLCLATSHILITALIVINGRGPSRYHIGVSCHRPLKAVSCASLLTKRFTAVPGVCSLQLRHVGFVYGHRYARCSLHHLERYQLVLVSLRSVRLGLLVMLMAE